MEKRTFTLESMHDDLLFLRAQRALRDAELLVFETRQLARRNLQLRGTAEAECLIVMKFREMPRAFRFGAKSFARGRN
jgi:hypothetical protein